MTSSFRSTSSQIRSIALFSLGLTAAGFAVEAQSSTTSSSTAPSAQTERTAANPSPPRRGRADSEAGEASGWWNRKVGEELALSADQKKRLDERAKAFAEQQRTAMETTQEHRDTLRRALEAGNWEEARRLYRKQSDEASRLVQAQGENQIALLSLLTDEQRRRLAATHGHLLTAPWRSRAGRSAAEAPEPR